MKKIILSAMCAAVILPACADGTNQLDDKSRVSYAVGMMLGKQWQQQELGFDPDVVLKGIKDSMAGGATLLSQEEMQTTLQNFSKDMRAKQQKLMAEKAIKNKADGDKFLAENAKKDGVQTLDVLNNEGKTSQLQYQVITNGTGAVPGPNDTVSVHYRGTLIDGTEFDSSYKRNQPTSFPVGGVIKGWTEGVQLMVPGEKRRFWIPADLAYGENPGAGRPGGLLVFDIELIKIGK